MKSCRGLSGWVSRYDMKKVDWTIVGQGRKRQVRSAFQGSVISLFHILHLNILHSSCELLSFLLCILFSPIPNLCVIFFLFFFGSFTLYLPFSVDFVLLSSFFFLLFFFLPLLCYIWQNLSTSGFLSFLLCISVLYLCILYPCLSLCTLSLPPPPPFLPLPPFAPSFPRYDPSVLSSSHLYPVITLWTILIARKNKT